MPKWSDTASVSRSISCRTPTVRRRRLRRDCETSGRSSVAGQFRGSLAQLAQRSWTADQKYMSTTQRSQYCHRFPRGGCAVEKTSWYSSAKSLASIDQPPVVRNADFGGQLYFAQ